MIVLLRHGRPVLPSPRNVTPAELPAWIAAYDQADLDHTLPPPRPAIEAAQACRIVVCSHLRRSTASALALGRTPDLADAMFQELGLSYADWPGPRLPAQAWLVFFGLLSLLRKSEFRRANGDRARQAARRLSELASSSGPVLFIGHGLMNRAVARQLLADGWQGPARASTQHWGFSTYTAPGA